MFRQNYRLCLVRQTRNRKHHYTRSFCDRRSVDFFNRLESWQCESSKNCCALWLGSIFKRLLLSLYKFDFLHPDVNQKSFTSSWSFNWKSHWLSTLHQTPITSKTPKESFQFFFFPSLVIQTYVSLKTYSFIFSIRIGFKNFQVIKYFRTGKLSFVLPWIRVLAVRKFRKVLYSLILPDSQMFTSEPVENPFSQKRSQKKILKEELSSQKTLLVPNLRILVVQNLQKTPFNFCFSSTLKSCFPQTRGFIWSFILAVAIIQPGENVSTEE